MSGQRGNPLRQVPVNVFCDGPNSKYFSIGRLYVPIVTTQLCHYIAKITIDNT